MNIYHTFTNCACYNFPKFNQNCMIIYRVIDYNLKMIIILHVFFFTSNGKGFHSSMAKDIKNVVLNFNAQLLFKQLWSF